LGHTIKDIPCFYLKLFRGNIQNKKTKFISIKMASVSVFQLSSANPFLALLSEPDQQLKILGLQKLKTIVDFFWAEIAEQLNKMYKNIKTRGPPPPPPPPPPKE